MRALSAASCTEARREHDEEWKSVECRIIRPRVSARPGKRRTLQWRPGRRVAMDVSSSAASHGHRMRTPRRPAFVFCRLHGGSTTIRVTANRRHAMADGSVLLDGNHGIFSQGADKAPRRCATALESIPTLLRSARMRCFFGPTVMLVAASRSNQHRCTMQHDPRLRDDVPNYE